MRSLALAAGLVWLAPARAADTPEVAAAVAALEKLGARITRTTKTLPAGSVYQVTFSSKAKCQISDDDLRHLAALPDLEWAIIVGQKNVTGDGLKHLTTLPHLEHIDLARTPIEGKHLKHLGGMKQLVRLGLWDTAIDDAGLAHLKDLRELEFLFLTNAKVGDAGIKNLGGKPKLYDLRLGGTGVTDACLPVIKANFPKVGSVTAKGCKISPGGAKLGEKLGVLVDFTTAY